MGRTENQKNDHLLSLPQVNQNLHQQEVVELSRKELLFSNSKETNGFANFLMNETILSLKKLNQSKLSTSTSVINVSSTSKETKSTVSAWIPVTESVLYSTVLLLL